jgi:hypothetical protein
VAAFRQTSVAATRCEIRVAFFTPPNLVPPQPLGETSQRAVGSRPLRSSTPPQRQPAEGTHRSRLEFPSHTGTRFLAQPDSARRLDEPMEHISKESGFGMVSVVGNPNPRRTQMTFRVYLPEVLARWGWRRELVAGGSPVSRVHPSWHRTALHRTAFQRAAFHRAFTAEARSPARGVTPFLGHLGRDHLVRDDFDGAFSCARFRPGPLDPRVASLVHQMYLCRGVREWGGGCEMIRRDMVASHAIVFCALDPSPRPPTIASITPRSIGMRIGSRGSGGSHWSTTKRQPV